MAVRAMSKTNKESFMLNDFQGIQQYLYINMNQNCANLAIKPIYNLLSELVALRVSKTGMVHFCFKDCTKRAVVGVSGSFYVDVVVENAANAFKSDCDEVFSLTHQMKTEAQFEIESMGQLSSALLQPDNAAMFLAYQPSCRDYGSVNDVFLDWSLGNGCYCFIVGQRTNSAYTFRFVFYYGQRNAVNTAKVYMGAMLSKFGPFFGHVYAKDSMICFNCLIDSKQFYTEEQFKSIVTNSEFFKKQKVNIAPNVTYRFDSFKGQKTRSGYTYSICICVRAR